MPEQGDTWRGMGHSQVTRGSGGGDGTEEQEGERSSVASSSGGAGFDYKIEPDGEVIPIGGGEEEEEEEGEEEGGGGEKFPPLPEDLGKVFTVHKEQLFENDPDLAQAQWEWAQPIASEADYLVLCCWQLDRVSGGGPGALESPTLNGKAPNSQSSGVWTGAGSGGFRKRRIIYVWENPEAGPLIIKLVGGVGESIGQAYVIALPISVKGGINTVKSFTEPAGQGQFTTFARTSILPQAYVYIVGITRGFEPPPDAMKLWTGYQIFRGTSISPIGSGRASAFQVFIGLKETGEWTWDGLYPAIAGLYSANNYGSGIVTRMNL